MPYPTNTSPSQDFGMKRNLSRKRKTRFTRKSVLKMLAVMAASQNYEAGPSTSGGTTSSTSTNTANSTSDGGKFEQDSQLTSPEDFLHSGRTGRRNALADILSEHACFTSSDLPNRLQKLTTTDAGSNSSSNNDGGNCSKANENS